MADPTAPPGTTFAVSAVADDVFDANPARDEVVIANDLSEIVYLQYGADAVVGKGPRIPPGGTFADGPYTGGPRGDLYKTLRLSAITAGAGGNLSCSEGSRTV